MRPRSTALKDCNGVMIRENDVVRPLIPITMAAMLGYKTNAFAYWRVEWSSFGAWELQCIGQSMRMRLYDQPRGGFKVVGRYARWKGIES